jgi:DNA-binding transcriptional MerR regulator
MAREAEVSTATVRMYEREGFFPPVERSISGHRRYRQIHL